LLRLPYFWDEAGYYIPAARDLLLSGSLVPQSTVSNAHPPLVLAWLALWWKVAGYAPVVTRTAMLVVAAFSLLGVFRLAQRVANTEIAIASTLCTTLYPVFFAQSSLAHVDLASAGLLFWGLAAYVEDEFVAAGIWFALAALAKETAIIAPLALVGWEMVGLLGQMFWGADKTDLFFGKVKAGSDSSGISLRDHSLRGTSLRRIASLLLSALPLTLWYAYHYSRTGYIFGNPEFFRYNVAATLSPLRFFLALLMRLWQVVAYLHLWVLTLATVLAMLLLRPLAGAVQKQTRAGVPAPHDIFQESVGRPRISVAMQMLFYVIVAAYVLAMALIGGAVLARYMLPAVPLVIIVCASTLWRRVRFWPAAVACVALAFVTGWFWNPHYGFSPEDNLAYRDYIQLHEEGERFLEARYPMARVLTAWPASDEITRPWLGYITRPMQVVRMENFSLDEMLSAAELRSNFEVALIFSTKYEPGPAPWDRWQQWNKWKSRFFDFHRDLPPAAAAQILGGRVVFSAARTGQWIAVIELGRDEIQNARLNQNKSESSN
jgi:hypothetical protein